MSLSWLPVKAIELFISVVGCKHSSHKELKVTVAAAKAFLLPLLVYTSSTPRLILMYTLLCPPTKSICSPMFSSPGRFCFQVINFLSQTCPHHPHLSTPLFLVTFPPAVPSLYSMSPLCVVNYLAIPSSYCFFLSPGGRLICLSCSSKNKSIPVTGPLSVP